MIAFSANAQSLESILKPSDTLIKSRRNIVVGSQLALSAGAIAGLSAFWYSDFPRTNFHFINDNASWLQMDKAGHLFSSYALGKVWMDSYKWAGTTRNSQIVYGATSGFLFLTAVEVLDGYSTQWGFSWGDVAANASGTALLVGQELLWKEQRIVPKFSFHTTVYASARPEVLGSSVSEQLVKDYNGQTYWLSANVHSFFKGGKFPKWLNIAAGYGGEGMVTAQPGFTNAIFLPTDQRYRQYYLSLDVDFTKIRTKNHLLKTVFSLINTVKVPAPTLEFTSRGNVKFHAIYF